MPTDPLTADAFTDAVAPTASEVAASKVTGHAPDCRCRECWAIRTGFDIGLASAMAAGVSSGRAQAVADILALIPTGSDNILAWLHSHGLGMAGPGAVLNALRHDIKQAAD